MCAEFPTRFNCLFRGTMWSGVDKDCHGYTDKVNIEQQYWERMGMFHMLCS